MTEFYMSSNDTCRSEVVIDSVCFNKINPETTFLSAIKPANSHSSKDDFYAFLRLQDFPICSPITIAALKHLINSPQRSRAPGGNVFARNV